MKNIQEPGYLIFRVMVERWTVDGWLGPVQNERQRTAKLNLCFRKRDSIIYVKIPDSATLKS